METTLEQRKNSRTELSWPVSIWMPHISRFCTGRSANISETGVLISVSMATPIQTGNIVEMNFPRTIELAKRKGCFARIKTGKVVRIERNNIFKDATIRVAIQFQ